MSRKQLFRQSNNQTVAEIFERFVASQTAKGVSDKTIRNYHSHLHSLQKHLDFSAPLATLTKEDLDNMVISMRQSGLAHNSISSYLRVFRTFLNWARKAGYTELEMANYKDKETVKETYKDGRPFAGYIITISGTLDMSAHLWEPTNAWGSPGEGSGPLDGVTIRGQDGVIQNLSIRGNCSSINDYPYACGFIGTTKNPITVKNLTFDSANVSINGQYYGNQVGVVIGHAYCNNVTMDNVHVTNSTVKGFGKVGGLVGHLAEPDGSHFFRNCSV